MNSRSSSIVSGRGEGLGVRAGEIAPFASTCHWHLKKEKIVGVQLYTLENVYQFLGKTFRG